MDVDRYLARIKIGQTKPPSLPFLTRLMEAHLKSVPFENLDILLGRNISLEVSRVYEKVVEKNRGGYCFELNGLFAWLLRELGFQVDLVSAHVFEKKTGLFGPEFDHLALLVHLDRVYLVDVGFGESYRRPVALPNGEVEDIGGRRRMKRMDYEEGRYLVELQEEDTWLPQYSFNTTPRQIMDFQEMNVIQQTSKTSFFKKGVFCMKATENGWITLRGNILRIMENGNIESVTLPSTELRDRVILTHFAIQLERE